MNQQEPHIQKDKPSTSPLEGIIAGLKNQDTHQKALQQLQALLEKSGEKFIPSLIAVVFAHQELKKKVGEEKKALTVESKTHDIVIDTLKQTLLEYIVAHGDAGKGTSRFLRCNEHLLIVNAKTGTKEGELVIHKQKPHDFERLGVRITDHSQHTPDRYKRVVAQITFPAMQFDQELQHFITYANQRRSKVLGFRVEGIEIDTTKDTQQIALRDLLDGRATYGYVEITQEVAVSIVKGGKKERVNLQKDAIFRVDEIDTDTINIVVDGNIVSIKKDICTPIEWCTLAYPKQIAFKENKEYTNGK